MYVCGWGTHFRLLWLSHIAPSNCAPSSVTDLCSYSFMFLQIHYQFVFVVIYDVCCTMERGFIFLVFCHFVCQMRFVLWKWGVVKLTRQCLLCEYFCLMKHTKTWPQTIWQFNSNAVVVAHFKCETCLCSEVNYFKRTDLLHCYRFK